MGRLLRIVKDCNSRDSRKGEVDGGRKDLKAEHATFQGGDHLGREGRRRTKF